MSRYNLLESSRQKAGITHVGLVSNQKTLNGKPLFNGSYYWCQTVAGRYPVYGQ